MELKATDFRVALVAKRQEDLHGGKPDYFVYAGSQLFGRIYQTHLTGSSDNWFWGINGLTVDLSVGAVITGIRYLLNRLGRPPSGSQHPGGPRLLGRGCEFLSLCRRTYDRKIQKHPVKN